MKSLHKIKEFFETEEIALVGVSHTKSKFGNISHKELNRKSIKVYLVHHSLESFDNVPCVKNISDLPESVSRIVVCIKPEKTAQLLQEIKARGIDHVWIQQGAENSKCIAEAEKLKLDYISGECMLMYLDPVKGIHRFHRGVKKLFGSYPK